MHVGRGRRPFVQPDQDRPGKAQAPRRQVRHRSTRCAPATRRSPTNGCRSSPGTDGLLALSMVHVLLKHEKFDWEFLVRYTNAPWLVVQTPGAEGRRPVPARREGPAADLGHREGSLQERHRRRHRPGAVRRIRGARWPPRQDRDVADGRALSRRALRAGERRARNAACRPRPSSASRWRWRTSRSRRRSSCRSRGPTCGAASTTRSSADRWRCTRCAASAAHSNGFQTCRAMHLIQMLLGALDAPGNFRAKRAVSEADVRRTSCRRTTSTSSTRRTRRCRVRRSGFPTRPEDLVIDEVGNPLRIDKAYSWEAPIATHGLMHMVITNAVNDDPYAIDTLILFMANMAWNSTMNTANVQDMLRAKDRDGEYKIPFLVVIDAFHSEMMQLRRPGPAGHDLPRALRHHLDARSADFRAGCGRRRHPPPAGQARSRRAAVAGGAWSIWLRV